MLGKGVGLFLRYDMMKLNLNPRIQGSRSKLESMIDSADSLKPYGIIDELRRIPKRRHKVSTQKEILDSIVEKNQVLIVAGAFFGDEGKGKTVDAIARHKDVTMVARFNSGSNAGHTVTIGGKEYIFHLCPSGIMVEGVTNYIGSECVMDPVAFFKEEIEQLIGVVDYKERLLIDDVHIVTPYHRLMDLIKNIKDDDIGKQPEQMVLNNSSTLQGISPAYASKAHKHSPRLSHIFSKDPGLLKEKLTKDIRAFYGMLKDRGITEEKLLDLCSYINSKKKRIPEHVIGFLRQGSMDEKIDYLVDIYHDTVRDNSHFPLVKDVHPDIIARLDSKEKLLVEASQSFFLSNRIKTFFESSTSADTTAWGVLVDGGLHIKDYDIAAINVHKAPGSSRVGRGANPSGHVWQTFYSDRKIDSLDDLGDACNDFDSIQSLYFSSIMPNGLVDDSVIFKDDTGEYPVSAAMAIAEARHYKERGATTKKPRVTGLFDCVLHAQVMKQQGPYTTISALDRADDCDKVGVVIAYIYHNASGEGSNYLDREYINGTVIRPGDPLPDESVLQYCRKVVKVVDGWKDTPIGAGKGWMPKDGIPAGVKDFLDIIEHHTQAKIISIGNGPEADNLIYLGIE